MLEYIQYKDLLIKAIDCIFNKEDQSSCIKLLKEFQKNNPEIAKRIMDKDCIKVSIPKLLALSLSIEVFNIQSTRTLYILNHYFEEQKNTRKAFEDLVEAEPTLDETIKAYKEFERELHKQEKQKYKDEYYKVNSMPNYKKFTFNHHLSQFMSDMRPSEKALKIKRNSFEYIKIKNYQNFELNNNVAFEFAKRKYPILYMHEYKYVFEIAYNLFRHITPVNIKSYLNEDKLFNIETSVLNYKDEINQLIKILKDGGSFFDVIERFYIVEKSKVSSDEEINRTRHMFFFFNKQKINTDSMLNITPIYRLPKIPNYLKWEVNVKLNLALPDDQLMDYIKHLKKTLAVKLIFDENDLFRNINLEDNSIETIKNLHKKMKKTMNIRDVVSDILFTYDCLKLNLPKKNIADEINAYYDNKLLYPNDLITAYAKVATHMIEEEYFSTLVDA